ncbi:MAG: single-stranded-DNA-specific exonuclease RecJ [Terracidiphilus sp.]|nr:single-stranded-DNA-specific exonuclease RecJ [Terracidiphilus sp.]MDR3775893.1 single-stranded-DNA-specific exonuclease RecJ [Terracidiphilus sp.]
MSATSSAAPSGLAVPPLAAGLAPAHPRNLLRQRWILSEPHPAEAAALAKEARLPLVLAELLVARGITQAADAFIFLNPESSHLHDPFLMLGMTAAVERLEAAIARREPVLLYGDYDVDGTTAVVLLKTAIEMLGGVARFHVPHRLLEGYGLQSSVLQAAHAEGARLVITVDTGMRAFAEAETARDLGLDLIITDHHLLSAGDAMPVALAVLNPNQPGCGYPEKSLCGAAIALKLAQAVLERRDPARTRAKTLPSFLKMAAIATIADAVPLKGENRVIAALGLKELRQPVGAGLRALFNVAALDPGAKQITGFDIGFRIAPRINAAGRMDIASEVIELFTTRDPARAAELAAKLERLNQERRATEAEALSTIEARLATDPELAADRLLVVDGDGWHRGVIGILASRVVDRTAKPAIVISVEDGVASGSGRSVDGFHLLNAIESCADLFTRFGGHAFAVGFSLPADSLPELKRRLRLYAEIHLADREPERLLHIHAELPLDRITPVLAGWLHKLEPLGHGNAEPMFVARGVRLLTPPRTMKDRHIRLELAQQAAPGQPAAVAGSSGSIRAVGWDLAARAAALGLVKGSLIDIAYRIRENTHPDFGGLEVEIAGIEPATA